MKRIVKIASLILLMFFTLFAFTSCNKDSTVLKVGMECAYLPMNWQQSNKTDTSIKIKNGSGYADGYDVQIAKKIGEKTGKTIEIYQMSFNSLVESINSGKIDLAIAGMSPTEERKKIIDFSDPYWTTSHVILMKNTSTYYQGSDATYGLTTSFKGAKVAGQDATQYDTCAEELGTKGGALYQTPLNSTSICVEAVRSGTLDITVLEEPVAMTITQSDPSLVYVKLADTDTFTGEGGEDSQIAVGLRKIDTELKTQINEALQELDQNWRETTMLDCVSRSLNVVNTPNVFTEYAPLFLKGLGYTILLAILGTSLGLFLAFFMAILRMQKADKKDKKIVKFFKAFGRYFAKGYITLFRGTPMMVQAMVIYYGSAYLKIPIPSLVAGIITISLNTTAYLAEVLRGGIQSVDKGQIEASRCLGFSSFKTFIHVVMPQAFKNVFPSIGNEFIVNIKDSSVLNVIQVTELFFFANQVGSKTYQYFGTMLVAGLIYLVVTILTSFILNKIEKKLDLPTVGIVSSN